MENRARLESPSVSEDERVDAWRIERFLQLGYPVDQAIELATVRRVDPHDVENLIRRGCPPATAVRILA